MIKLFRGGRLALLVVLAGLVLSGCMPRGGATNPGWTALTADSEAVYVAQPTGVVVALRASDGQLLWNFPVAQSSGGGLFSRGSSDPSQAPLDAVYGSPVLTDGLVVLGSLNDNLYAFDRVSGQIRWQFSVSGGIVGGVTVADGVAYFGSADNGVYAVDVETGESVWEQPFLTGNWVWGAPAVDADNVYVGSMDRQVYAIDRETGTEAWQHDVGASVPGDVTLADGRLYVGAIDRKLHVLDVANGDQLWEAELGQWVSGDAVVLDNQVYVTTLDGKAHALSLEDGTVLWSTIQMDGAVRSGPVLADDLLIVGTDTGGVYRVSLEDGSAVQLATVTGGVLARPPVVGNVVYIGTAVGNVAALDVTRQDGAPVWVYPPSEQ